MRVSCYILCCRLGPYSRTAHAFSAREVVFEERVASQCEMSEDQAWNTAENDKEVISEHGKEGEEEVAEGEDNEDEIRLMRIEHRIMTNEFPIVLKQEQSIVTQSEADSLLTWVQKEEYVKLHSYIMGKYTDYRKAAQVDEGTTEALLRARYMRDTYYAHLKTYKEKMESPTGRMVDLITVMLGEHKLDAQNLKHMVACASKYDHLEPGVVGSFVDKQWAMATKNLSENLREVVHNNKAKKEAWLHNKCMTNFKEFFDALLPDTFVPELPIEDVVSTEMRAKAKELMPKITAKQQPSIAEGVMCKFEQKVDPAWREDPDVYNAFLQDYYWLVVEEVVTGAEPEQEVLETSKYTFVPKVALDVILDVAKKQEVNEIIGRWELADEQHLESKLTKCRTMELSWALHSAAEVREAVDEAWLYQRYFDILLQVNEERYGQKSTGDTAKEDVRARRMSADEFQSSGVKRQVENRCVDMFSSPKRRAGTAVTSAARPICSLSIGELHLADGLHKEKCLVLEARLLYVNDYVRHVPVQAKGKTEKVQVLSVTVADRTAVIINDFWREAATGFQNKYANEREFDEAGGEIYVRLHDFDVRQERKPHLTPMCRIHSNERTTVDILRSSSAANLSPTLPLEVKVYTNDMSLLLNAQPLPQMISLCGVVVGKENVVASTAGNDLRTFQLVDGVGKYVRVIAFDRHATNPIIENGNMLVLYMATAQEGIKRQPGALWMYNDSHMILLRSGCVNSGARDEIVFGQQT